MRKVLRTLSIFGLTVGLVFAMTVPASAFIHEIVASHCSGGNGNVNPPGLTAESFGGTGNAVAQPLFASGAYDVTEIDASETFLLIDLTAPPGTPPTTESGPATLIELNDEQPQVKFSGLTIGGEPVFFSLGGGTYLQLPEPDHTAFEHCKNFGGH